jgi:hypothetical protein
MSFLITVKSWRNRYIGLKLLFTIEIKLSLMQTKEEIEKQ